MSHSQAKSAALTQKIQENEKKLAKNLEKHNKAKEKYEDLELIKLKKQGVDQCQHGKDRCRCGEPECLQQLQTDCSGYAFAVSCSRPVCICLHFFGSISHLL